MFCGGWGVRALKPEKPLLGASWVVKSYRVLGTRSYRVLGTLHRVTGIVALLFTLHTSTHEPPSKDSPPASQNLATPWV